MSFGRAFVFLACGVFIPALFSACARVVSLDPAPDAASRGCSELMVRLPDMVDSLPRQGTDAQSTAAWGSPAEVLVRCGVSEPAPTTQRCVSIDDVDWIIDEGHADYVVATTYGRTPAAEVVVSMSHAGASVVLADLARAFATISPGRRCG